MKIVKSLLAVVALTASASAVAGSTAGHIDTALQLDTIEKKLTLSCFNNRMGDRAFIGAPKTISFCRAAARQAVDQTVEGKTLDIAALSQESSTKVN